MPSLVMVPLRSLENGSYVEGNPFHFNLSLPMLLLCFAPLSNMLYSNFFAVLMECNSFERLVSWEVVLVLLELLKLPYGGSPPGEPDGDLCPALELFKEAMVELSSSSPLFEEFPVGEEIECAPETSMDGGMLGEVAVYLGAVDG